MFKTHRQSGRHGESLGNEVWWCIIGTAFSFTLNDEIFGVPQTKGGKFAGISSECGREQEFLA